MVTFSVQLMVVSWRVDIRSLVERFHEYKQTTSLCDVEHLDRPDSRQQH